MTARPIVSATRRRRLAALALACAIIAQPTPGWAWADRGHRIVAIIASWHIRPETTRKVQNLLDLEGAPNMAVIASWADRGREQRGDDQPQHSVRMPLDTSPYTPERDCRKVCAIAGLETYASVLRDVDASPEKRLEALKYVVHLVGDIHQPLHASSPAGGQKVVVDGAVHSLHYVWDAMIVKAHGGRTATVVARELEQGAPPPSSNEETAVQWAEESRALARDVIFKETPPQGRKDPPTALSPDYLDRFWPVAAARLRLAGYRLARLLDENLR